MKKMRLVLLAALLVILSACAMPMVSVSPNPSNPIYTVAIMPVYNASNDVDGPAMVREIVQERIHNWQYNVMPLKDSDQALRDKLGITLGSQLEDVEPRVVADALGVDGLLYGYLVDFDQTTTGILNVRKVRAGFKLVDAKTGRAIWSGGIGVKTEVRSKGALGSGASILSDASDKNDKVDSKSIKGLAGVRWIANWVKLESHQEDDAAKSALFSLGQMAFEKALSGHLKHESEEVVRRVFSDFPAGHGAPQAVITAAAPVERHERRDPGHMAPPYMEFEDFDFYAEITMTMTSSNSQKTETVMNMAKTGNKSRSEFVSMTMSEPMPFKMPRTITITTGEKNNLVDSYTLFPDKKKYIENKHGKDIDTKEPKIEKVKLGEEKIDGHPCEKFRVTITSEDGTKQISTVWKAKDLKGFMIRAETEDDGAKTVVTFSKVKLGKQNPNLFVIPGDYTKSNNPMEMMTP